MKKTVIIILIITFSIISNLLFKKPAKITEERFQYNFSFPFFKEEKKDEYLAYMNKTQLPLKQSIINVNIGLNHPFYTNIKESIYKDNITILVNKYNYLPKDFIPTNLVVLTKYAKSGIKLKKEAYDSFLQMANEMKKNNLEIRIISAYRSYEYQENLYNNYLKTATRSIVDTYSARPGHSEHQTGLVIDVDNNKEMITGYKYEPWHYRYVGKEIAEYIKKHNISYEEYYYEFIDI